MWSWSLVLQDVETAWQSANLRDFAFPPLQPELDKKPNRSILLLWKRYTRVLDRHKTWQLLLKLSAWKCKLPEWQNRGSHLFPPSYKLFLLLYAPRSYCQKLFLWDTAVSSRTAHHCHQQITDIHKRQISNSGIWPSRVRYTETSTSEKAVAWCFSFYIDTNVTSIWVFLKPDLVPHSSAQVQEKQFTISVSSST